jgi:hypothetical protein
MSTTLWHDPAGDGARAVDASGHCVGRGCPQVFTAWLIFHECIGWPKRPGTVLVALGIPLIPGRR